MTTDAERKGPADSQFVLNVSCRSAPGQVASIVKFLDERSCYIEEFDVFDDTCTAHFFVRTVFHVAPGGDPFLSAFRADFGRVADLHEMTWSIYDLRQPVKVMILVSRLDHCLADLIFRWRMKELRMDIVAVVSNHADLAPLAVANGLPFHHLPVTSETKAQQEEKILQLIDATGADLVVLARYMQILSPQTSRALLGRAINIHHSFLPGFKGARPYHQAHSRGVKVIGATAHFVTDDLDEGPIIEQVVERVTHAYDPERLLATGRDMECLALARAVKLYLERRIFLNQGRTVVFA